MLKKIPIDSNGKTVYDNLSIPIDFYLMRDKLASITPTLSYFDYFILWYYGLKYMTANNRKVDYYKTKLLPIMKELLSEDGEDILIESLIGPGFGMEKKDVFVRTCVLFFAYTDSQLRELQTHTQCQK